MHYKSNISAVLGRVLLIASFAAPLFAHGGFEHVAGNVVKVASNVMTVKTSTGSVDVKLDAKTEVTKNKQKAQVTDLTPGTRVVVDLPEEENGKGHEAGKVRVAHAVKIGAAPPAKHDAHGGLDAHDEHK